jgi:hypothetical protein
VSVRDIYSKIYTTYICRKRDRERERERERDRQRERERERERERCKEGGYMEVSEESPEIKVGMVPPAPSILPTPFTVLSDCCCMIMMFVGGELSVLLYDVDVYWGRAYQYKSNE